MVVLGYGMIEFPDPETANADGLLAAGGNLDPQTLLAAYSRGIFPWFDARSPILWWSPDPRMVLFCDELKVSRSLAKSLRNKGYRVRTDTAFRRVLEGCAGPRRGDGGTWLGEDMRKAYFALHRAGHAHCFETWRDGELVGIFSERDLMRRVVAAGRSPGLTKVSEVMTANPRTVSATETVENCLFLMQENGFRHLPVCEGKKLRGLVSLRDLALRKDKGSAA